MPGKAKEQKPIGIPVKNGIKPLSVSAFLKLEPGYLAVTTVKNGGKLGDYSSKQERYITLAKEEPSGKDSKQKGYERYLVRRNGEPSQISRQPGGQKPVEVS